MKVRILRLAEASIAEGADFYEGQSPGLGTRFVDSIMADIRSLSISGGTHRIIENSYHRKVCTRFPFSIYYRVEYSEINVYRVLDNRRDPEWISERLD